MEKKKRHFARQPVVPTQMVMVVVRGLTISSFFLDVITGVSLKLVISIHSDCFTISRESRFLLVVSTRNTFVCLSGPRLAMWTDLQSIPDT